jgi:hypothetical protein
VVRLPSPILGLRSATRGQSAADRARSVLWDVYVRNNAALTRVRRGQSCRREYGDPASGRRDGIAEQLRNGAASGHWNGSGRGALERRQRVAGRRRAPPRSASRAQQVSRIAQQGPEAGKEQVEVEIRSVRQESEPATGRKRVAAARPSLAARERRTSALAKVHEPSDERDDDRGASGYHYGGGFTGSAAARGDPKGRRGCSRPFSTKNVP